METDCTKNECDEVLQSLDLKSVLFLILDNYALDSINHLVLRLIAKDAFGINECRFLSKVADSCFVYGTGDEMRDAVIKQCDIIFGNESSKYINTFLSVYADFREIVPHIHYTFYGRQTANLRTDYSTARIHRDKSEPLPNCHLREDDLYFNSYNEHICDECGEPIEPGDPAYFRTDPVPTVRHRACNVRVKRRMEFKYIDYFVKSVEYHESVFRFNENCYYIFRKENGFSLKQHTRYGYIIDKNDCICQLPNFGRFVVDFISGEDDYDLIKKYRPYHVYLEFLIRMFGYYNDDLADMGGYKYLLREPIGRSEYPELCEKIDSLPISKLMFDKYIHKMVAEDIIDVIYETAINELFRKTGIYVDDQTVLVNGTKHSFTINNKDPESEISITVDKDGVYCVDFEKSLSFTDYFGITGDYAERMLRYMMQFEVDK